MPDRAPTDPSPSPSGRWADLRVRVVSGATLVAVGVTAIALGGIWFQMLAVFATAIMVWEIASLIRPNAPVPAMLLAALTASVLSGLLAAGAGPFLVLLAVPPALGALAMPRLRLRFVLFALAIVTAGWGLVTLREAQGGLWLFWLVGVVVATDMAGYFAGRALGGPKFWPRISPKKTWSGTMAGWIAAAGVGAGFVAATPAAPALIGLSAALSFASQMGDIAVSALKRRTGAKDASDLLPGHGGLCDRFDGLLGGVLFLLALQLAVTLPDVRL